jgi:large subunit ribosomal protein L10
MNKDQKAAVIDEIAANISDSAAIFAVDYRGISVEQARELRGRLREADATLRVVKNSLAERAADKAGAELIKTLLQGPTALTFVRGDGAVAAKSLADFARSTQLLAFKGGVMDGAALSAAEMTAIARLPTRDALYGQLVGLIASPVAGLARALNALIGGLAIGLGGVLEQKAASAGPSPLRSGPKHRQFRPRTPKPSGRRMKAVRRGRRARAAMWGLSARVAMKDRRAKAVKTVRRAKLLMRSRRLKRPATTTKRRMRNGYEYSRLD